MIEDPTQPYTLFCYKCQTLFYASLHVLHLSTDRENLLHLRERNENRRGKTVRHEEKKCRIRRYIEQVQQRTHHQQEMLDKCFEELGDIRRQHVNNLVDYIFTIEEIKPKR